MGYYIEIHIITQTVKEFDKHVHDQSRLVVLHEVRKKPTKPWTLLVSLF